MMNAISVVTDTFLGDRTLAVPARPNFSEDEEMNALVWYAKNVVQYKKVPRPLITDAKDVLIRVIATTICGSDIHLVDGSVPTMRTGDILGHEFVGIIEEVGVDVKKLKKGQRVAVAFDIACGECDFCKRKEFSGCKATNPDILQTTLFGHNTCAIFGYSHLTGGVPGGQSEIVRVPWADVNCLVLPDKLSDERALLLTDVIPTAYHGAKLAHIQKNDVVAVWGLGPVGLLAGQFAKNMGASRVIGIDCVKERLEKAVTMGIEPLNFEEKDVVKTLHEMFPDGIDAAIECAGGEYSKTLTDKFERAVNMATDTSDIFKEMFMSVRPFGRVSVIGVYIGTANHFPVGAMMEKALTIRGGQCPVQKYWPELLKMLEKGEIVPEQLITHHGTLEQGPEFYKKFLNREEGILKVILRPQQAIGPQ